MFESLTASHSFLSGIPSDCCWLQACNLCQICNAVSALWPHRCVLCDTSLCSFVNMNLFPWTRKNMWWADEAVVHFASIMFLLGFISTQCKHQPQPPLSVRAIPFRESGQGRRSSLIPWKDQNQQLVISICRYLSTPFQPHSLSNLLKIQSESSRVQMCQQQRRPEESALFSTFTYFQSQWLKRDKIHDEWISSEWEADEKRRRCPPEL